MDRLSLSILSGWSRSCPVVVAWSPPSWRNFGSPHSLDQRTILLRVCCRYSVEVWRQALTKEGGAWSGTSKLYNSEICRLIMAYGVTINNKMNSIKVCRGGWGLWVKADLTRRMPRSLAALGWARPKQTPSPFFNQTRNLSGNKLVIDLRGCWLNRTRTIIKCLVVAGNILSLPKGLHLSAALPVMTGTAPGRNEML